MHNKHAERKDVATSRRGQNTTLAIMGGTIIDGTGGSPIPDGIVVIQGGRITDLGSRDAVSPPTDARVVSVEDGTVLPGFIDSHIHVEGGPVSTILRQFLVSGVTSVGNTGSTPDMVANFHVSGDATTAARGFIAGPVITAPGGYPSIRGDGSAAFGVDGIEEASAAVDKNAARAVDFIKVAQEPFDFNYRNPGHLPVPSPDILRKVVERADEHGLIVRSHVHHADQLDVALDAGVTSIEHTLFPLPRDCGYVELYRQGNLTLDTLPKLKQRIDRMVSQGVYLVPTISNELANIRRGLPDFPADGFDQIEHLMVAVLSMYVEAGGTVALGSDWVGLCPPGISRADLRYFERAGMPPMQIIEASTRHAAAVCGQAGKLGVLKAGFPGDVVVVAGDPLRDVGCLEDVRTVIKDGRVGCTDDD